MNLSFTIPGEPVGKGRPKFTMAGRAYTPAKTAKYENLVRLAFYEKYSDWKPYEDAVSIKINSYFPIPGSWSKKKKSMAILMKIFKISRPDLDNIIKSVCDGLNEVAWKDDAQIYELYARKAYSENPRTEVEIEMGVDPDGITE